MIRVAASRPWIARRGPAPTRVVAISFSLSRRATVVVRVDQVAPVCRFRGTFVVRGRAGRNVLRFRGRVRNRLLSPGTYRLTLYPRGRTVEPLKSVTVVILSRPGRVATVANAAAACPVGVNGALGLAGRRPFPIEVGVAGARARISRSATDEATSPLNPVPAAVGSLAVAAPAVQPALLALAALAVLLLVVASMPQPVSTSPVGAILARQRRPIAIAGAAVLVTSLLAFLLL